MKTIGTSLGASHSIYFNEIIHKYFFFFFLSFSWRFRNFIMVIPWMNTLTIWNLISYLIRIWIVTTSIPKISRVLELCLIIPKKDLQEMFQGFLRIQRLHRWRIMTSYCDVFFIRNSSNLYFDCRQLLEWQSQSHWNYCIFKRDI